jgi:hypothetical protein
VQGSDIDAAEVHFAAALELPGKEGRRIVYLSRGAQRQIIERNPGRSAEDLVTQAQQLLSSDSRKTYTKEYQWGGGRPSWAVEASLDQDGGTCSVKALIAEDGALADLCVRQNGLLMLDANGLTEGSGW